MFNLVKNVRKQIPSSWPTHWESTRTCHDKAQCMSERNLLCYFCTIADGRTVIVQK